MKTHQVFNAGSVKDALEQKSSFNGLRKKASGPAIDNSLTSRFAAIDFGKIRRAFHKEYRVPKVELQVEEVGTGDHDGTIDMDSIINSALAQHEKRLKQNFLFDRIRAISSETKRINANIELGNKQS
ncbi:hypothetical protein N9V13_05740 [Betaproteobacteria bacterium]|nr:hypothetical protein [Betaproteobacteria bacterium]